MTSTDACFICGDPTDHGGTPHAEAHGDGRTRADLGDFADLPRCTACRYPLTPGGVAIICGPRGTGGTGGTGGRVQLPGSCTRQACREARDDAALEKAIAAGVITR